MDEDVGNIYNISMMPYFLNEFGKCVALKQLVTKRSLFAAQCAFDDKVEVALYYFKQFYSCHSGSQPRQYVF